MKIEHIALWTNQLEIMKDFYCEYFNGISNTKYTNTAKGFSSYFITFEEGARFELMSSTGLTNQTPSEIVRLGYAHIAMDVGDKETVIRLTELLRNDGYIIASEPRITGDGYFESVILDPDGNRVEITS